MGVFAKNINILIMPLTVFAKSSSLEVYLTEPARSMSDWESSFYKQIKKENYPWHTYISFEKRAESHSYYVQIEICCNEIDSDNIIHVYIQAKTDKAVK